MPDKIWGEITYPFLNFNYWSLQSNVIPHFIMDVISYSLQSRFKLIHVSKRGTRLQRLSIDIDKTYIRCQSAGLMSNQCPSDGLCYRLCHPTLKRNCHVDAAVLWSFVSILYEQQVNHPTEPHVSYTYNIIWCQFKLPKTWYYFNPMSNRINFVSPFQCVAISVITQLTLLWVWACQSYLPISSRD